MWGYDMIQRTRKYSIKKRVLTILMGMLVPLLIFLMFLNWFIIKEVNYKLVEAINNTLYIQCENMEKTLGSIENAMVSITADHPNFHSLVYGKSSEYDDYVNAFEVAKDMEKMMYPYNVMTACVLVSVPKNVYRINYNIYHSADKSDKMLLNGLKEIVLDREFKQENKWTPIVIGDNSYLVRILGYKGTYLIGIINLDHVILMQNNKLNEATTVFYDENGYYTGLDVIKKAKVELKKQDNYYYVGSYDHQYMVVENKLQRSDLRVAYLTPKVTFMKNLSIEHLILLSISLCLLLAVPIGYHLLKKLFFHPLDSLVGTMEQIRDGNKENILSAEYREVEFQKVEDTLLSMVQEIGNLKIQSYEKELQINRTQLQFYQVQIKPHFYLNCLKNIYGMVAESKFDDIQKLIILLSKHLRYMLQEERMTVAVEKELEYIKNYVELQQICMKYPPSCIVECDADLYHFEIPAISLLSFVENSVKYGMNQEKGLQIYLHIQKMMVENEQVIYISITDNGQGYDKKMLDKLNFQINTLIEEGHLGIYNVIQRYKLQYGKDKVIIAFSNYEGASTEIFIRGQR